MIHRSDMERVIPLAGGEYDVIVAGGGPAGVGAALAAGAQGARTLLLEARATLGGVAAVAMWMPMNRLLLDGGPRGGVHDLFVAKLQAMGDLAQVPGKQDNINGDGLDIHPEYLQAALFELLEETGCHYRLFSPVTDALMEGNAVRGVVAGDKTGSHAFAAGCVVDATGDGDVAYHAGAAFMEGREEDGVHMPISLVFALANVDEERLFAYLADGRKRFKEVIAGAAQEGYATAPWYSFDRTTIPGVVNVNNGAWEGVGSLDGLKARDLTIAQRAGVQVAVDLVRLAREKGIPGLEECCLMRVGANLGIRDTRRIMGDYVLTQEDALTGPEFEDVIARKYGAIDANQLYIGPMRSGFAYPYRSLLPKGIENLLIAGRCGSATFLGHAAGKSMGNMMALGQAAGLAAVLSSAQGVTPRALGAGPVQARLREWGVQI